MSDIPRKVLSEAFQEAMEGQRLIAGAFLTFRFEPDFFEQEVLAALLDLPLQLVADVRLVQLEDALQKLNGSLAVYYDQRGLVVGERSAKLDVRRIPVHWSAGAFHPKNVLILTESVAPAQDGTRPRRLLFAAMSANLTRAGWWQNVEVAHIETVGKGELCGYRNDLRALIRRVIRSSPPGVSHGALEEIQSFLHDVHQHYVRSWKGVLHPRLYAGGSSVVQFLQEVAGAELHGKCLEVISPYFDKDDPAPLRELVEAFEPEEVRVHLPRGADGKALVYQAVFDAVRTMEGVSWGTMPQEICRNGTGDRARPRTVHAKVYRFFDSRRCAEMLFVGSVNLTRPAFSKGGNFETGFLIDVAPSQRPTWWLASDRKRPIAFEGTPPDDPLSLASMPLSIRFSWDAGRGEALWDTEEAPRPLKVFAQGVPLFILENLEPHLWRSLTPEQSNVLKQKLKMTSYLTVRGEGREEGTILVLEEGMAQKPSLLLQLSVADILRYWALLTPEQRQSFLEERVGFLEDAARELGMEPVFRRVIPESMFTTFAGIYHAFNCLETAVRGALDEKRWNEAEYRLLGQKYDSLPHLVGKVIDDERDSDPVTRYVTLLAARQAVRCIARDYPEFRAQYRRRFEELDALLTRGEGLRDALEIGTPTERAAFLGWFEQWFMAKVRTPAAIVSAP